MSDFVEVMNKKNEIHDYYMDKRTFSQCPLNIRNNGHVNMGCNEFVQKCPEEAEKIIMAWGKPIDWSKVPVDTKILVRNSEGYDWKPRYFAKYEDGKVYTWIYGATSWSIQYKDDVGSWKYAKLAD